MVGKNVEKISNGVSSTGTQNEECVPKKRTSKNSDTTSNSAGFGGAKKIRKMRKFRYENCAERNGQKCAVFRLIRGEGCKLLDDNDRRQLSDFA